MEEKYFVTQIQRKNGEYIKGVVVKNSLNAARQSYHAYLGAYGFEADSTIDYVACYIADMDGVIRNSTIDDRIPVPEPEPAPEEV